MVEALIGNYGLPGIIVVALLLYLKYVDRTHRKEIQLILKEHREERGEWAKLQNGRLESLNSVLLENTGVLRELKGALTAVNRRVDNER